MNAQEREEAIEDLLTYLRHALGELSDSQLSWLARHPEHFDEQLERI